MQQLLSLKATFHSRKAFTLMEVMVVAVLVSVLAVMALASYTKVMTRAHVDDAIRQLTLIHSANQVYKVKNGQHWPAPGVNVSDINQINTALGLSLRDNDFTFSITGPVGGPTTWFCTMTYRSTPNFVVTAQGSLPLSATNPQCTANCP